jgi:murein L,D-transpeptidase YafK
MGLRALFTIVSAAVFAAAFTAWLLSGRTPPPVIKPDPANTLQVEIAPPAPDELPAPRTPKPPLPQRLAAAGLTQGDAAFIRIFKQEQMLEVWLKDGTTYRLFDTFPICFFSGALGPKLREGDGQAPEGFYEVRRGQLNPNSAYHLAFNLGYPNAYDRAAGRTGSHLMVHGNCVSIGCYAMTDYGITEIYGLVEEALNHGQAAVPVHIFPFRMNAAAMKTAAESEWFAFWQNLKEGHDAFEAAHVPPRVCVSAGRYAFNARATPGCTGVNGS